MHKNIVFILPTIPNYRRIFFEKLQKKLVKINMQIFIIHGSTNLKVIVDDLNPKLKTIKIDTLEKQFWGYNITIQKRILQELKIINPDYVIILFSPGIVSLWKILFYCKFKSIPIALWGSGYIRPQLSKYKVFIRKIFLNIFNQFAKEHITYSLGYKEYLKKNGIKENKIFIAQNTIDVKSIIDKNYSAKSDRFKSPLKILFVGALINDKQLPNAIRALRKIIDSDYEVIFNLIGSGNIGNELKSLVSSLDLEKHVNFLGAIYGEEVKKYFIESDIFLLPGSGGLAINEAMAYGLPIISTAGDGTIPDLIDNNGYLLSSKDNEMEIFYALEHFIKLPYCEKLNMSDKSKQIVLCRASIENMVNQFVKAIYALRH